MHPHTYTVKTVYAHIKWNRAKSRITDNKQISILSSILAVFNPLPRMCMSAYAVCVCCILCAAMRMQQDHIHTQPYQNMEECRLMHKLKFVSLRNSCTN